MGFLRKVGRKVNRALSKVFGQKLGNLIGGIGLSMVMWGGAKVLFPNLTNAISQQMTNLKTKVFGTPTEAVADISNALPEDVLNTAKNADVVSGATGNIMDTSTFKGGDSINIVEGAGIDTAAVTEAGKTATPIDIDTVIADQSKTFTPEPNSIQMMDTKAKDLAGNVVGGLDTSAIKDFKGTPIDIDALYAQNKNIFAKGAGKLKDYVTDGNFIGDVGKGVATSVIMQEIAGEPEQPFRSGGVASQPLMEAAQGNYMRDVGPLAMAATGMTRMPSFQELSQQTLYGTGSPSWMAQFYQPLATPQGIG